VKMSESIDERMHSELFLTALHELYLKKSLDGVGEVLEEYFRSMGSIDVLKECVRRYTRNNSSK